MQETDKDIFEKDAKDYLPVFNRYKIVLDHGEGAYLWDNNGKKYLDFLGGIAVNVLGHDYEPLVTAISEQAKKLIHCSNLYYTQPQVRASVRPGEIPDHHGLGQLPWPHDRDADGDGPAEVPRGLRPAAGRL